MKLQLIQFFILLIIIVNSFLIENLLIQCIIAGYSLFFYILSILYDKYRLMLGKNLLNILFLVIYIVHFYMDILKHNLYWLK